MYIRTVVEKCLIHSDVLEIYMAHRCVNILQAV